jgi:hypothetical protein
MYEVADHTNKKQRRCKMPNIRPMSDLKNNATEISDFCKPANEPVFITRNGASDMVVLSVFHDLYLRRYRFVLPFDKRCFSVFDEHRFQFVVGFVALGRFELAVRNHEVRGSIALFSTITEKDIHFGYLFVSFYEHTEFAVSADLDFRQDGPAQCRFCT